MPNNNTTYQLKLPIEISTIIEISDPVYAFCEVMYCIDLRKYLAAKESRTGRKRYNSEILLKVICPNGKEFKYLYSRPVRGNKYGRTEELYQCEDCAACPHKEKCCKCEGNRIVRLNEELTGFHKEVLGNLKSIHGALLRMNRSIQAEGAFGAIKWNKAYQRIHRRGLKSVILEISMISCGFNLHKYHLKSLARQLAA